MNGANYIDGVMECFWTIMEYLVPVMVPFIALLLVFKIIKGLIK